MRIVARSRTEPPWLTPLVQHVAELLFTTLARRLRYNAPFFTLARIHLFVRPLIPRLPALITAVLLPAVRRPKLDAAFMTRESRNLLICAHPRSPPAPVGAISGSRLGLLLPSFRSSNLPLFTNH